MNRIMGLFAVTALLGSLNAQAAHRVGLSLGGGLGFGGALTYDYNPMFAKEWSLGGEFYGMGQVKKDKTFLVVAARSFYWENPTAMTGFFGGPKAALVSVSDGDLGIGLGGEGGWSYRFGNNIDLGASLDVFVGNWVFGGLRLNVGFLIP